MMKITFLGHAGIFVETQHATLLCDPWFHPAFFASWFPFPSNENVDIEQIKSPTYLYISHMHHDHFDPLFLRDSISKEATVLLPDYPLNLLERALRDCGFNKFIYTKSGQMKDLNGLRIMIIVMSAPIDGPLGDSSILIDDNETCIFNQNDSRPIDLDLLKSYGPYDAHFLQYSGAIWYPMVYQYPANMLQVLGRKKRTNGMERALRYICELNPKMVIPSAGPPCFLDDSLFDLNDFDRNPTNPFPDQTVFLEVMQSYGLSTGRLAIPGSIITLTKASGHVQHPFPDDVVQAIFTQKRTYLEAYKTRKRPLIDAEKRSWPRGQVNILTALQEWFEPLLKKANLTSIGINGRLLIDCGVQQIMLDFHTRKIYTWDGSEWDYHFRIDHALLEYCIIHDEEDWVNQLFLSFRFEAQRKGPYNEFLYNFFKCLTPERLQYAENYYSEKTSVQHMWESHGYSIQKYCPHLKTDLTRFSSIENGVLTCSMHGWQFELATGRCLTTEGYRLYTRPVNRETTASDPVSEPSETSAKDTQRLTASPTHTVRTKCNHCWYHPSDIKVE